jgi:hypothetical protein
MQSKRTKSEDLKQRANVTSKFMRMSFATASLGRKTRK